MTIGPIARSYSSGQALPADWEAGRRRYFTINWIQLTVTWAAFALFLVALISL
jgi:hypothetical protein